MFEAILISKPGGMATTGPNPGRNLVAVETLRAEAEGGREQGVEILVVKRVAAAASAEAEDRPTFFGLLLAAIVPVTFGDELDVEPLGRRWERLYVQKLPGDSFKGEVLAFGVDQVDVGLVG